MSKHTPGPWELPYLDDGYSSRQAWITDAEGAQIASLEPGDNMDADARLMAAAPELLEAVQRLIGRAAYESEDAAFARAAIQKATGEQP